MENLLNPHYIAHVLTVLGVLVFSSITASGATRLWEFAINLYKH
jgi:hypothetical protein